MLFGCPRSRHCTFNWILPADESCHPQAQQMSSSALISSQWDISVSTNKFQEGNGREKGMVSCTLINLSQGSVNRGTASVHPVSKQGVFFLFPVLFSFGFGFYRWSQHTSEHSYYYPMTPPVWLWLSPVPLRLPTVAWNRPEGWLLAAPLMHASYQDPRLCRDETDRREM